MCRNIRVLFNFDPPATDEEIESAAIQYVRKVSGAQKPSKANQPHFDRAVRDISRATRSLLDSLSTSAAPRDRDVERTKARERWQKRASRIQARPV